MSSAVEHALTLWPSRDGVLQIAGQPLREALSLAGGTPAFLYSRELIVRKVTSLRQALGDRIKIIYSIKANPHPAVVATLAPWVNGFDVASLRELSLARGMVREGGLLQFSGPGKMQNDFRAGIAAGAVLNIESLSQMKLVAALGQEMGTTPAIALRVNPLSLPGGGAMRMNGRATQFGIDDSEVPAAIETATSLGLNVSAMHFYWGTQALNGTQIATLQTLLWEKARAWIEQYELKLQYINLGGGFGIPYHASDKPLDLSPIAEALGKIHSELTHMQPQADLVIELGRYLVGESGLYVSTVVDVKRVGGELFAITDGGMHHHLAASGNLGQRMQRNFPVVLPEKLNDAPAEALTVTGCLCTPMDVLARSVSLPRVEAGDLVAVLQSGAYGPSASPAGFLSHEVAHEQVF